MTPAPMITTSASTPSRVARWAGAALRRGLAMAAPPLPRGAARAPRPARQNLQLRRHQRRARRERRDVARSQARGVRDGEGDLAQALLALAGARAEAGVALHLLEIGVARRDGLLDVVERDVLTAAEDDLARHGRGYFLGDALGLALPLVGAGSAAAPPPPSAVDISNSLSGIGSSSFTSITRSVNVSGPSCVSTA